MSSTNTNNFLDILISTSHDDSISMITTCDEQVSSSKYFAADKYEYEISPELSSSLDSQSSTHVITETSLPTTKTIYLIRHAESDENRRKECLKTSMKGLGKLKLPKREDVVASMELMNLRAQLDSNVSPKGQQQINQLGQRLAKDDFVHKMGIELVAHSPLRRARQTSYGILQCVAPASIHNDKETNNDPTAAGAKHPAVKRVVELDILSERTPMEWLPIQHDAFTRRIAEFEMWLSQQPEDVIAIVGHSLYFKNMLGLESKFHNVDVWSLQFDYTLENSVQKVRKDVLSANEIETKKKIQKHFENLGNFIPKQRHNMMMSMRSINEFTPSRSNSSDELFGDNANEDSLFEEESENRDENNTPSETLQDGIQNEIDGVLVEELVLPRGWRQLKHHYRFDPNYSE